MSTLRRFSVFIAAAFVLPALGMVIGGFDLGRKWVGIAGIVLLVSLGVVYFVILYHIMKSRKIGPDEAQIERRKRALAD